LSPQNPLRRIKKKINEDRRRKKEIEEDRIQLKCIVLYLRRRKRHIF